MISLPEISFAKIVKRGAVSFIISVIENRRATLVIIARPSPKVRALLCSLEGSLPDRIEIKIILSIPRTISNAVKVNNAIQTSELVIQSIKLIQSYRIKIPYLEEMEFLVFPEF